MSGCVWCGGSITSGHGDGVTCEGVTGGICGDCYHGVAVSADYGHGGEPCKWCGVLLGAGVAGITFWQARFTGESVAGCDRCGRVFVAWECLDDLVHCCE